ncbi:TRAP transporter large permease [Corynebacterium coyleae]|uniref:TRAP transporter large permease n=1 Tax=Corynebacterium coyleae TaxID=53374 RepID=UPI001CCDE007|nr:TRAP transporter large permease [Corynebacterium coyleae]UBI09286.1 TRAP transporter large permease [Corynebacterium coyleae]
MALVLLFGVLFLLLLAGVPIAYCILAACVLTALILDPGVSAPMIAQTMITANDSFPIMAIPFFILSGLIMGKGGISRRLFEAASAFVGHIPGGVGIAAVITAMFFSAISGSGPATVAAIGGIMIPEMIKLGYSRQFSAALIAAAGTIGVVIPPSIPLVVFGVVTGTSIGDLFFAAVIPGILMALVLILWVIFHARKHSVKGTARKDWPDRGKTLVSAIWGLLLPVIILGGIYGGAFTPTEAAVIAVVYGVIVGCFIHRELKFRDLLETFGSAAMVTSSIMIIVAAAAVFSRFLAITDTPATIVDSLTGFSTNPIVIILMANLILLLLGTFMETIAAVTIISPILVPVLSIAGMDPVQIGVLVVVIVSLGFITPPLGVNMFIAANVAKTSSEKAFGAVLPGLGLLILVGLLVSFIPPISLAFL